MYFHCFLCGCITLNNKPFCHIFCEQLLLLSHLLSHLQINVDNLLILNNYLFVMYLCYDRRHFFAILVCRRTAYFIYHQLKHCIILMSQNTVEDCLRQLKSSLTNIIQRSAFMWRDNVRYELISIFWYDKKHIICIWRCCMLWQHTCVGLCVWMAWALFNILLFNRLTLLSAHKYRGTLMQLH